MSKLIAIMGVTGQQGGGAVDAMLSAGWKVRGITRDASNAKATDLIKKGVEIVEANASDEASPRAAFKGAHAIFANTNFWEPYFLGATINEAAAIEEEAAVTRTRAAAATDGLEHYIFVSLPHADKLPGGRIPLQHLDAKAQADEKIRQTIPDLASRMTSLFFGMYMFFFPEPPFKTVEMPGPSGKHALILPATPDVGFEVTGDMSVTSDIWVRQILAAAELTRGKYAGVGTEYSTLQEILQAWNEMTGKPAVHITCTAEAFIDLWGPFGRSMTGHFQFSKEFSDWTAGWEDKWLSREDLGITAENAMGIKFAYEQVKDQL